MVATLTKATTDFMGETKANFQNQQAAIKNLEIQMGHLANMVVNRTQGSLPSNTETNPKEHVKTITLRSGKQLGEQQGKEPVKEQVKEQTQEETMVKEKLKEKKEEPVKPYNLPVPFPQRLKQSKDDKNFLKFLEVFKKLHINILFAEALAQMPSYAKFLKDILSKKRRLQDHETVMLTEECNAIIQNKLPSKLKDPGSFTIPCNIGNIEFTKALCDLGASINLMPLSIFRKLGLGDGKPISVSLQLADRSVTYPNGIVEDVLVKVDKFIFPVDFIVLDMEEDREVPLILGRPFLATGKALIDVHEGKLTLRVGQEDVIFNVLNSSKYPLENDECFRLDVINKFVSEIIDNSEYDLIDGVKNKQHVDVLNDVEKIQDSIEAKPNPKLELKQLPSHLRYAFLGDSSIFPVIISAHLSTEQEKKLLHVLKKHKRALGWSIDDIKGISPSICMHKILMEENYKPSIEHQRRLNPNMKELVRAEVMKLLDAGIIYPISDSSWVSPVQVVPKKGGMTVITNNKNELIPTRTVTGWRVCIDYRKLNKATRKDHFPLPFIDQLLERLSGYPFYYFLDGYSGYFQILIVPEDQEKTTFTCPYGTFAYRRMPFGLCNAPATFQRCMMSIFSDMVEKFIEIFMDDFSIFGPSFDMCLTNLSQVLQRCEETNLVLNWEKCHFMVQEGVVLGHKISSRGIEVDKAKVEVIEKLPPPTSVKGVRSFLGHAGFYRRFIKDFSKITKPLCKLLIKDAPFKFTDECLVAFNRLKRELISAPIITAPDWNLPFELMCDASDYAIGAVLGQRKENRLHVVYYASRTLNDV